MCEVEEGECRIAQIEISKFLRRLVLVYFFLLQNCPRVWRIHLPYLASPVHAGLRAPLISFGAMPSPRDRVENFITG